MYVMLHMYVKPWSEEDLGVLVPKPSPVSFKCIMPWNILSVIPTGHILLDKSVVS